MEVIAAIRELSLGENTGDYFDVDEIIRFFAVHNFVLNYDSYIMLYDPEPIEAVLHISFCPRQQKGQYPPVHHRCIADGSRSSQGRSA